jgi:hypothetical protein
MCEKSKNGIGNPTQKEFIFIQKTWKKGRVADPTLLPKISRVCLKDSYPSSCAEKQIFFILNSVCNKQWFYQLPLRNLNLKNARNLHREALFLYALYRSVVEFTRERILITNLPDPFDNNP